MALHQWYSHALSQWCYPAALYCIRKKMYKCLFQWTQGVKVLWLMSDRIDVCWYFQFKHKWALTSTEKKEKAVVLPTSQIAFKPGLVATTNCCDSRNEDKNRHWWCEIMYRVWWCKAGTIRSPDHVLLDYFLWVGETYGQLSKSTIPETLITKEGEGRPRVYQDWCCHSTERWSVQCEMDSEGNQMLMVKSLRICCNLLSKGENIKDTSSISMIPAWFLHVEDETMHIHQFPNKETF